MRSAEARLGVLDSLDTAVKGVGRTWEMMSVPRLAARWGLYAVGGVFGITLLRRIASAGKRETAVAQVAPGRGVGATLLIALLQLLPVVAAPWLKQQAKGGMSMLSEGVSSVWQRVNPMNAFFRWLGL